MWQLELTLPGPDQQDERETGQEEREERDQEPVAGMQEGVKVTQAL